MSTTGQSSSTRHGVSAQNCVRAEPTWPAAVIAGGWRTGMLGMRSLIRRGVPTCCVDTNPRYPAFKSAYGSAFRCPNPDTDPVGWVAFMIETASRMGGQPVLIASADQFVSAIAEHEARLAPYYLLSPGVAVQGLLATKQTQYRLAFEHGMPMPRTQCVSTAEEVTAFAEDAVFPCLVKPLHFREWQGFADGHPLYYQKIAIAKTPSALMESWCLAASINPNVILQEIIQGSDVNKRVYVSCYDRAGRRIANAMFRELRCDPVGFGPATVSEPVVDPEADRMCDTFLRSLAYSGVCEIELKRDDRDGQVKLIEANPRLTGGGDAAPYAGVDVCWLHYLDMIGKEVAPVTPNGKDFRHIVLRSDVGAIIGYRRAGLLSWYDVVRSFRPPLVFFDLDRDDWRYSLETFYIMVRSTIGLLLRSLLRDER